MLSEVKKQENRKRTMAILSDKRLEYQKHKVNKLKKSRQSQVKSLNARKSLLLPFEVCQGVTVKSKLLLKPPVKKSTPSMKNSIGGKGKASAINKIFRLIAKPSHSNSTKACEKTKQSSQPSSAQVNDKTSAERNKRKKTEISLEKSRDPVTLQKRERDLSERYVELFGSATPPTPGRSIEHLILGRNKNKSMTDLISNNSTELPKGNTMKLNQYLWCKYVVLK